MIVVTKYSTATGEILGSFYTSNADSVAQNISDGEAYVDGEFFNTHYRVVDNTAVRKSDDEIDAYEAQKALNRLRQIRNKMLSETDWTQAPDAPVDSQAWATYRQALRDLPDNTEDPRNPAWPTKPT